VALRNPRSGTASNEIKGPWTAGQDGIDAFVSEESLASGAVWTEEQSEPSPGEGAGTGILTSRGGARWIGIVAAIALIAAAGAWAYQRVPGQPQLGSLALRTTPPGLEVAIDGKPMGKTPLDVTLAAGNYTVVLSDVDGPQRTFPVTLTAGGSVVQHLEMPVKAVASAATGALRVETSPARQPVLVDGVERGMSPITVSSLAAGDHVVVVRTGDTTLRRTIAVKPGETVSLVVSAPVETAALRAGWVTFESPIALSLREGGKVVGTTDADRLMLPVGNHEIEMVNETLGFRATRRITVAADKTTSVAVEVPNGTVSINALPWAEVWFGGERIGETPIANLSRPIGSHEVVLRHPQFGERKARLTVTQRQTARLGVDMRTP
jgi:hypothetical protein